MVASRLLVALVLGLVSALGCGPAVGLDDATGSATDSSGTDPTQGDSADETGGGQCGVGETEVFGGGPPGPLGFPPPCNPSLDPGVNGYRCCSDDPAVAEGQLPAYTGKGIDGAPPFFADVNNDLSDFGICVDTTQLAGQGLLAAGVEGCPIPCNPTWPVDAVDAVCGPGRACCQTVELQAKDCVQDLDTGLYRPVTGDDIPDLSLWRPADHATHQDPNGTTCLALASGDSSSETFQSCVRALGVADQRGYCLTLAPGDVCPQAEPSYIDACEQLNGG